MSANDKIQKEIDWYESKIEELILKISIIGLFDDELEKFKRKYENAKAQYHQNKELVDTMIGQNPSDIGPSVTMAEYDNTLENELLPALIPLYILASSIPIMKSFSKSDEINYDAIKSLLDNYLSVGDVYHNCKKIVYQKLIDFLYYEIKKEVLHYDTDNLIKLMYDYEKASAPFVIDVNIRYLKEVQGVFSNKKSKNQNAIEDLALKATDGKFDKEDIVRLLIAIGENYKPKSVFPSSKGNTTTFNDNTKYKPLLYTDRIIVKGDGELMDISDFKKLTKHKVNPLPRNRKDNLKLREYDLTYLEYSMIFGFLDVREPKLKHVDLSYTNAIIPPQMDLSYSNLEGVDMRGINLEGVDITGTNLLYTGADITGTKGDCLGVSMFIEPKKVFVSDKMITPYDFEKITGNSAFPTDKYLNRILRCYDISCIDYSMEYFAAYYKESDYKWFDFSYTNVQIDFESMKKRFKEDPKIFKRLGFDLEGIDLRNVDFTGYEEMTSNWNLAKTGANVSPKINQTVSEYVEATEKKSYYSI